MSQETVIIPEKLFFKIGEVCELVGVQAHVLRYWESEFSTLSPQKNKSGQRSYRRRDVEIALRIKQLLYNEMFTIAGAKKKLQLEQREGNRPKPVAEVAPAEIVISSVPIPVTEPPRKRNMSAPMLFETHIETENHAPHAEFSGDQREALKVLASHLLELREILKSPPASRV